MVTATEPFSSTPIDFLSSFITFTVPALAFGYIFVLIGFGMYQALSHFNKLKMEAEPNVIQAKAAQIVEN